MATLFHQICRRRALVASLVFSLALPVAAFATAVPFISQPPVPAAIAPGGAGFNLTLNGTGFLPNATMNWTLVSNGIVTIEPALSLTCSIETQCTVVVPGSYYATAGTAVITVVNPGPPSLTSNFVLLPVTSATTTVTVNRSDFAVGNNPVSVVAADFNGDGILDLAVANNADSTISILLGNVDGTFTVQTPITLTGVGPTALITADFNNDGSMDLAVVDNKSNRVGILLGHGDGTFGAETEFVVGSGPSSVAAGDFNGDGKLDLAVTNSASNTVSILLGKGDGTFNTKSDISTGSGSGPSAVAVGDLNLDGKLDLVVADKVSGKVSVLLGNGDGTFQSHADYTAGKSPTSVVIATFNESNHNIPDVVAVNSGGSQISYFKGVGDGTLNAAVPFATGSGPFQAMVGDFNGDGHLDVAVTDTSANAVTILLGNGNGTFQSPINLPLSGSPVGIAVGDFNGDGRLDFATADSGSKTVSVELQSPTVLFQPTSVNFGNQNVGTTSAAQNVTLTNSGSATLNIQSIAIAGTNSADFAVQSTTCGSTLAVGANCTIALTFTPSAPGSRTAQLSVTDNAPNSPQTVNLSGTGISTTGPLASVSPSSLTFASQPVGTTSPSQPVTLSNLGNASLVITSIAFGGTNPGDFGQTNGCGASLGAGASCTIAVTFAPTATGSRTANLIITDNSGNVPGSTQTVSLTGTGTNQAVIPVPQIDQPLVPDSVAPGSAQFTLTINGAEFFTNATANWTIASGGTVTTTPLATSCVVSTQCTATVPANLVGTGGTATITVTNPGPPARTSNMVFLPIGTSLTQLGLIDTDFAVGTNPQSVAVADFNGDGIPDVAVANNADNTVSILLGSPKGDGTFVTPAPTYTTGTGPVWVIAGDFNNDGKQDLAVVDSAASTVSVLLGNGDGTFQAKIDSATGTAPTSVAAGDFNGDGFVDLAVADSSANTVSILLGNGDGTFKPKNDISTGTGSGPSAVAVADVNGDGLLDVVVTDKTNGKMSVLLGNGDGTFKAHVDYAADKAPSSLVVADFNGDGKPDVVVVDSGTSKLSFFKGNGDGTFQTAIATSLATGSGLAQVLALDLNEDGKLDLAVTGTTGNTISVLFGNGDGTFAAPIDFNAASGPVGIAAGDFTGVGRFDLVTADSGAAKVSVQLQGPSVGLSASSLSFGNQSVGTTSAAQNVILTNTGSATLNIQSIAITGTNPTDFTLSPSSTCGSTLAAAATCTISVTFAPSAAGVRTAQVAIADNANGSPQSVTLTGTGTQAAVTLSASSLTYSIPIDVGQKSVAQTVTLTNSGTDTLTFSSITVAGDFVESNDCLNPPANLAPNASCHISVTFQPTATDKRSGTVAINDNAPDSPQSIGLTGYGVIPTATLAPTILTFPSQLLNTASSTQTITISNAGGTGPLLITSISITGTNSGDFSQKNTCGTQVGAGASCTITVTFTPTAVGNRLAAVTVIDNNNGVNGNSDVATLSGAGIAPVASLSSTSLDFGNQSIGTTSAAQTVTLNNTGTAPLTVVSIVSSSGEYGQSNSGCTPTVDVGASCTITVTFTPSLSGTQSGTITITDNNNGTVGSTQTITVTGVGAAASITLTPSTLNFGNQTVGTTSSAQTITVKNNGSGADTINDIAATPSTNFAETDNCPRSPGGLAAGATCTVTVTFTPKAGGQYNGSLKIADTSPGSPHTASLSGTGSDFAVSVTPTSSTTAAGDSSTFTIQLTPSGGFNQQITLSCSGLPQLSACSFSPASTVTLDGTNPAGLTMNVTTTAPSMLAPVDLNRRPPNFLKFHLPPLAVFHSAGEVWLLVMWFLAIATIVGWHAVARRRASLGFAVAVLALVIAGSAALSACGGGGGTVLARPGTPVGTYSITITGASGTLSHTTTVTLTVD